MSVFLYQKTSLIRMFNGENQDLAVERICVEFKCALRQNDFFFLSSKTEKIIAFTNEWKDLWFQLAIEKLRLLGYDGLNFRMRSCAYGTYTALVWDTSINQEMILNVIQ